MPVMIPFNRNSFGFDNFYNRFDNFLRGSCNNARNFFSDSFRLDVKEDEAAYFIEAELPGVKKEEVTLSMDEGKLRIALNREEKTEDEGESNEQSYVHRERRITSASREVYLPDAATEGTVAKMEDGILRITVPKAAAPDNSKKIDIE